MSTTTWTRHRTDWHEPKRGHFSLPPGVRGHRVWLNELPRREQTIFGNILRRADGYVLVQLAGRVRALPRSQLLEVTTMTDATEIEQAAMAAALIPLGEYVGSIGMHRPLADYTKAQNS